MTIEKRRPMKRVAFRVPPEIIDKARAMSDANGVSDSDVYRAIIVSFFEKTVNKTETTLTPKRRRKPA
jgi:hypothetical protein